MVLIAKKQQIIYKCTYKQTKSADPLHAELDRQTQKQEEPQKS